MRGHEWVSLAFVLNKWFRFGFFALNRTVPIAISAIDFGTSLQWLIGKLVLKEKNSDVDHYPKST